MPLSCGSNPIQMGDRSLVLHVTRVQRRGWLEHEDMDLLLGHGSVFNATGNNQDLALFKPNMAIPELHAETALHDQERFVLVVVLVPDELPQEFGQFDLLAVQFANDPRAPMIAEEGQLFSQVDFFHSFPRNPSSALCVSCGQFSLSFRCVLPPRFLRFTLHETNGGDEGVKQAWIMTLSGDVAQVIVHRIRVTSRQFGGRGDPQLAQISGDGGANVRDAFETGKILTLLFHDSPPSCVMSGIPDKSTFASLYSGQPPWDIGKSQQPFIDVADRITGSILDAGCGTGDTALFLADRGNKVTGIDFLEEPIKRANRKAAERTSSATFLVKDAMTLKVWTERFDNVIDSGLFHVFSDEDRKRYVEGLATVLKPGGRLFLMCFSDEEPGTQGPRRISRKEIEVAFAEDWVIESMMPIRFEVRPDLKDITFSDGGPKAWFVAVRRKS